MGVCLEATRSEVRIVVVEPRAAAGGAVAALQRLGPEVRLEVLRDVYACELEAYRVHHDEICHHPAEP